VNQAHVYSMRRQLSLQLIALTLVALGGISVAVYWATSALFDRSHARLLNVKINKLTETSQSFLRAGNSGFRELLVANSVKRPETRLELFSPDGTPFYIDPDEEPHQVSAHTRARAFALPAPDGTVSYTGTFTIDVENDVQILRSIALVLLVATVAGALLAGASAHWVVRRGLGPLRMLTRQTERISTGAMSERLQLRRPVAELQPWVRQFNGLMDKVQDTYTQLESFNADVAHELRTPLTALIGKTEVALSRERSPLELSETLQANLQELQHLSTLVNDMLFLSKADHGALVQRGAPVALQDAAAQIAEFYEALAQERNVRITVAGSAMANVDESLFKRAVSNLLSNAVRFADAGSTIHILLQEHGEETWVWVKNAGDVIEAHHLPRLFDRFYRADAARSERESHHGLGLAIVAAIARMHGGTTDAWSGNGYTQIGFSIHREAQVPTVVEPGQPIRLKPVI
jgi:two-component system, OmpR family, heavy metal sensor histidine kinase CusS